MKQMAIIIGPGLTNATMEQISKLCGPDRNKWSVWPAWQELPHSLTWPWRVVSPDQWWGLSLGAAFCGWPDEPLKQRDVRELCSARLPSTTKGGLISRVVIITADPGKIDLETAALARAVIAESDTVGLKVEFDQLVEEWLARLPSDADREYFGARMKLSEKEER